MADLDPKGLTLNEAHSFESIQILFEDHDLLFVNKPSGLPTQGTVDVSRPNLYSILHNSGKWPVLGLHHRLDVATSGVLVLAKSKIGNQILSEQFQNRLAKKTYICLVGFRNRDLPWKLGERFIVRNHLKKIRKFKKDVMIATTSGGDFAETHFEVLGIGQDVCLIQAMPLTGRMHQIRVHMADLKFPILGDRLYGKPAKGFDRLMLHAKKLELSPSGNFLGQIVESETPQLFHLT